MIAFVLYVLIGAMAPFANYKKLLPETAASVNVESFLRNRQRENGQRFLKPETVPGKNVSAL